MTSRTPQTSSDVTAHNYAHDGFARHHHDADTGDPVWWLNCEQFGGSRSPHRHPGTPQDYGIPSTPQTSPAPEPQTVKKWTEMTIEDIEVRRDCDYQSGGDLAWRYMQAWRDVDFLLTALAAASRQPDTELREALLELDRAVGSMDGAYGDPRFLTRGSVLALIGDRLDALAAPATDPEK